MRNFLLFASLSLLIAGCGKNPGKAVGTAVTEYDAIATSFAPMFKAGTDKIEAGDMKGGVEELEKCMGEMAKVSQVSIEGCPEDFIMAWSTFVAKHDEARTAIGQFVASSKNTGDADDPIAGFAKMLLGGGIGAVMKLQQAVEGLQAESSKLKVVCSKYGVDGGPLDVLSRIEGTVESPTP